MFNFAEAELLLENFKHINSALPIRDKETTDDSQELLEEITLDIDQAQQLIKDFKKLEKPPERKKAFLEIIGLSHLESVSSKALAFFFNTDEAHQLKDLCVQALYDCILDRTKSDNETAIYTQSVEREVSTEENSRIDIIIDTYDDLIIIENKLFHSVNNPFESYVNYGKSRRGEKNGHYIILGIDKPEILPEHFKFVSHFDLGNAIRNRLGDYLIDADQHYLTLLIDYLHALDDFNPNSRIGKMEQAIVNFFGENHKQIQELYEARIHFIEFAEKKLNNLEQLFNEKGSSLLSKYWQNDDLPEWLGASLFSDDFESKEEGISYYICLGIYSAKTTLSIEFRKNLTGRSLPKDCKARLENILRSFKVDFESTGDLADNDRFVVIKSLPWNETSEIIVNQCLPIIKQIESTLNFDKEA